MSEIPCDIPAICDLAAEQLENEIINVRCSLCWIESNGYNIQTKTSCMKYGTGLHRVRHQLDAAIRHLVRP